MNAARRSARPACGVPPSFQASADADACGRTPRLPRPRPPLRNASGLCRLPQSQHDPRAVWAAPRQRIVASLPKAGPCIPQALSSAPLGPATPPASWLETGETHFNAAVEASGCANMLLGCEVGRSIPSPFLVRRVPAFSLPPSMVRGMAHAHMSHGKQFSTPEAMVCCCRG